MVEAPDHGPILDAKARAQVDAEQCLHKAKLAEIEMQDPALWPELLPRESDRHLKSLTRIYAALASRALDVKQAARKTRKKN